MQMTRALQFAMGDIAYEQRIADEERFRQQGLDDHGRFWTYYSDACDKAKFVSQQSWFTNFVTFIIIVVYNFEQRVSPVSQSASLRCLNLQPIYI